MLAPPAALAASALGRPSPARRRFRPRSPAAGCRAPPAPAGLGPPGSMWSGTSAQWSRTRRDPPRPAIGANSRDTREPRSPPRRSSPPRPVWSGSRGPDASDKGLRASAASPPRSKQPRALGASGRSRAPGTSRAPPDGRRCAGSARGVDEDDVVLGQLADRARPSPRASAPLSAAARMMLAYVRNWSTAAIRYVSLVMSPTLRPCRSLYAAASFAIVVVLPTPSARRAQ